MRDWALIVTAYTNWLKISHDGFHCRLYMVCGRKGSPTMEKSWWWGNVSCILMVLHMFFSLGLLYSIKSVYLFIYCSLALLSSSVSHFLFCRIRYGKKTKETLSVKYGKYKNWGKNYLKYGGAFSGIRIGNPYIRLYWIVAYLKIEGINYIRQKENLSSSMLHKNGLV